MKINIKEDKKRKDKCSCEAHTLTHIAHMLHRKSFSDSVSPDHRTIVKC